MNEIKVIGKQKFMGLDIPVVFGGFGEGQRCISDKTIAEIRGMREPDVRRRVTDNITRFKEGIDFIDFKKRVGGAYMPEYESCASDARQFLEKLGYTQMQISKAEHIYILSERGYAKLIKIMDTDLAWEVHDKLIDEYFELREEKGKGLPHSEAQKIELKAKAMRAEAMRLNARTRAFKEIKDSIPRNQLSEIALRVFDIKGMESVTGENLGDYLPKTEKTYSATETGNRLGITSNKVGKLANQYGIKTDEFGIVVMDKSPYSPKTVPSFRYNEKGVQKIKELLRQEEENHG